MSESDKRQLGYSRDKRSDCVQVVIALVVTPEGFPRASEGLRGASADKTTLKDFLARIERQFGKAWRIWAMGRGIPTEEVLEQMCMSDPPVQYVVGTPKGRLSQLEGALLAKSWQQARPRSSRETLGPGATTPRLRREPRPHRRGAQHAPPQAEVAVGAPEATLADEPHARSAADEARRGTEQSAGRLAARDRRDGSCWRLVCVFFGSTAASDARCAVGKLATCCARS